MRVVDSSAWVEWLLASPTGKLVKAALPKRDQWVVPTIIQLELAKWTMLVLGEAKTNQIVAFSQKCLVVPLTTDIALAAAEYAREHKLAIADAIIYATARAHDADVLTCDAHIEALPRVTFIAKRP